MTTIKTFATNFFDQLKNGDNKTIATDGAGAVFDLLTGIEKSIPLIKKTAETGKKLLFVGNGASAAMASHMSIDFWKNGNIRAIAFNDSALLTCIGNDYGYKFSFEKPVAMFADSGDLLIAISSSGRSENILLAVEAARNCECSILTLSGFQEDNPLRSLGDINFYVSFDAYGPVEVYHQAILHCLLDTLLAVDNG